MKIKEIKINDQKLDRVNGKAIKSIIYNGTEYELGNPYYVDVKFHTDDGSGYLRDEPMVETYSSSDTLKNYEGSIFVGAQTSSTTLAMVPAYLGASGQITLSFLLARAFNVPLDSIDFSKLQLGEDFYDYGLSFIAFGEWIESAKTEADCIGKSLLILNNIDAKKDYCTFTYITLTNSMSELINKCLMFNMELEYGNLKRFLQGTSFGDGILYYRSKRDLKLTRTTPKLTGSGYLYNNGYKVESNVVTSLENNFKFTLKHYNRADGGPNPKYDKDYGTDPETGKPLNSLGEIPPGIIYTPPTETERGLLEAWSVVRPIDCLAGDTLIDTPNGKIRLDATYVGQKVYCKNRKNQKVTEKIIYSDAQRTKIKNSYIIYYFANGTSLTVIKNHRVLRAKDCKFIHTSDLKIGDEVVSSSGKATKLIKIEKIDKPIQHYTIFTDNTNQYIANNIICGNIFSNIKCSILRKLAVRTYIRLIKLVERFKYACRK